MYLHILNCKLVHIPAIMYKMLRCFPNNKCNLVNKFKRMVLTYATQNVMKRQMKTRFKNIIVENKTLYAYVSFTYLIESLIDMKIMEKCKFIPRLFDY